MRHCLFQPRHVASFGVEIYRPGITVAIEPA